MNRITYTRTLLTLCVVFSAGCQPASVPDADTIAPVVTLRIWTDQGAFDLSASPGNPVRVVVDHNEDVLFTATAKDPGGVNWIEAVVDNGVMQGTGPKGRRRRELTRDQATSEVQLGTRVVHQGGVLKITASAGDFHGNSASSFAQADFPSCSTVAINKAGGNQQGGVEGVDFYSSGSGFNPASGTGHPIPAGITSVTNLGSSTIILRRFDVSSGFGQWSDPVAHTLAAGARSNAFNGGAATSGWWIVEQPGGPTTIEVCAR